MDETAVKSIESGRRSSATCLARPSKASLSSRKSAACTHQGFNVIFRLLQNGELIRPDQDAFTLVMNRNAFPCRFYCDPNRSLGYTSYCMETRPVTSDYPPADSKVDTQILVQ